jgi:uncharacterized iron-regulated membrane protein
MHKPPVLLGLHRWIALAFAPLLLIQAATGSVLLFRDELAKLAMPVEAGVSAGATPLSMLVQSAQRTHPDLRVKRLFFPVGDASAAFVQLEGPDGKARYAALDPASARVISSGSIWRFPLEAALEIHYRLMGGSVGLAVVALNGLALAVLAASGLWHWWPGVKQVRRELSAPSRAPARLKLRIWHRSVGAVLAVVLMTSATTGILLSVPNLPMFAPVSARAGNPIALDAKAIDSAFALAQASYPGSQPRDVRFAPDGTMPINFVAPRGGKWAVDVVTVSATRQRVISELPLERNRALWLIALPIHSGDTIGPAGRWPMLAAALALGFLAISGPIAWWRSRRRGTRS